MSGRKEQIRSALKKLAGEVGPPATMLAQVVSVDEEARTCTLKDEDFEFFDIRLRPVESENESIEIFPKVGSWVLAARIESDEEFMVIGYDEIDSWRIKAGTLEMELKNGKFLMKKGGESLGKLIDDLLQAMLIEKHIVGSPTTTSPDPATVTSFTNLKARFAAFLAQ
jgi:hypothetical protein